MCLLVTHLCVIIDLRKHYGWPSHILSPMSQVSRNTFYIFRVWENSVPCQCHKWFLVYLIFQEWQFVGELLLWWFTILKVLSALFLYTSNTNNLRRRMGSLCNIWNYWKISNSVRERSIWNVLNICNKSLILLRY